MINLNIDIVNQQAITSGWDKSAPFHFLPFRTADFILCNFFFFVPRTDPVSPYDLIRFQGATVICKLLDPNGNALSTSGSFSELLPAQTSAVTISIASPAVVGWTGHGFSAGQPVIFSTTGALPTGAVAGTIYYVLAAGLGANVFEIGATAGGSAINTSGSQSGSHTGQASPTITRVVTGTAALGEYDRITFPDKPFAGSYSIAFKSGSVTTKGATSATARIYPNVTPESHIIDALVYMQGQPYLASFVAPTIVDIHGAASNSTPPHVSEVNVTDLDYGFGWTGGFSIGAQDAFAGLDGLILEVDLTPSGGAIQRVLQLPITMTHT
jgi:hypothetical protein